MVIFCLIPIFLISSSRNISSYQPIFKLFGESSVKILLTEEVRYEYLRDAYLPEVYETRKKTIEDFYILPKTKSLYKDAIELSRIYTSRKIPTKKISTIDNLIAAYAKYYQDDLFIFTLNHKDFPTFIFDRVHTFTLDDKPDIITPALYKFNPRNYSSLTTKIKPIKP